MSSTSDTNNSSEKGHEYNVRPIQSPILTGWKLDAVASLTRSVLGPSFIEALHKKNDIACVRRLAGKLDDVTPLYYPMPSKCDTKKLGPPDTGSGILGRLLPDTIEPEMTFDFSPLWKNETIVQAYTPPVDATQFDGFAFSSIADYLKVYSQGEVTPVQVVKAYLEILQESDTLNPPLKAILTLDEEQTEQMLKDAQASAERYANGKAKGPLDGILVAVKDSEDVKGYTTTKGTAFLGKIHGKAEKDCRTVQLLRDAGAIIVGKTNMHELGIGTTGSNNHWGTPRNPYDPGRYTGGSSSGSAAAVAAGLVPLAVGADGGGSIRIPSALCGVVGLKATFKRIVTKTSSFSVNHVGPITTNVLDAAIAYSVIAGPQPGDKLSQQQPPPQANSLTQPSKDLKGIRIGIFPEHFEHADDTIVQDCRRVLKQMEALGAEVVDVSIPFMQEMNLAHSITITTEMGDFLDPYYDDHVSELTPETQISIAVGRAFSSRDFLAAQKVRRFAMEMVEKLFETIDVYVSPSTGLVAPKIRPEVESRGESNIAQTVALMRYMLLGNLTGIPGLAFPVGYTSEGSPTSMMIQSAHWNEDVLFRVAGAVESPRMRPKIHYSVLDRARDLSA